MGLDRSVDWKYEDINIDESKLISVSKFRQGEEFGIEIRAQHYLIRPYADIMKPNCTEYRLILENDLCPTIYTMKNRACWNKVYKKLKAIIDSKNCNNK